MRQNLEIRARDICELDLRIGGKVSEMAMASAVDRYWYLVADEINSGLRNPRQPTAAAIHRRDADAYAALCRRW